jgi:PAS domain S-box-containing protein
MYLVVAPDEPYTILAASQDLLDATYTDEAIFGRPCFEVFPVNPAAPEGHGTNALAAAFREVAATRASKTYTAQRHDTPLPPARGGGFEERYWDATDAPVLAADGSVEYIVHHTEDARAQGKRNVVQVLDTITEGFFTLDRHWRFAYVNREANHILEQLPGALTGRVLWEVYPGLEDTEFGATYRRTMLQRQPGSFTAFYAGQKRWYELTSFPAPEGVAVYFRNVTREREIEEHREQLIAEADRQRRLYETALNSTPDFIYIFDLDHDFLYANESLLETWGTRDYRGKALADLGYEPWHVEMHHAEIDAVVRTRAPIRGEVPFTGTKGRRVYDYIFTPVFGEEGSVVAVAGSTRDVTDRQAAEQVLREQAAQLAEADRAKDEFLATLSHELRNPLAPLRNSVALLRRGRADAALAERVQGIMDRQVNHLVRLVDDLLEVSRISRGTLTLRKEPVEAAAVVRAAVEATEAIMRSSGHVLSVEVPPQPLWLEGDPVRLAQILSNLLNNAAIYTDPGGRITVRVQDRNGEVTVGVRDNGIGIAAANLPRMFEMFSRGDRSTARAQGGLGIGLALSRKLAQMHGGSLDAVSEGPGHGSEFTLRLPLAALAQAGRGEVQRSVSDLPAARILVVDDNRDARESLAMMLEALGATVQAAPDGPRALEACAAWQPEVVLLDIGMPGMDGYEVARQLRSQHQQVRPVLVALTGWGQDEDRRRAREAGFDHHLVKPADVRQLSELLAAITATHR